jgi:hypothetical protein
VRHCALEIGLIRHRIIIEKVDPIRAGRFDGRISLGRWLAATRDDELEFLDGVVQSAAPGDSFDLRLSRASGNHDCYAGQILSHAEKLRARVWTSKYFVKS